MDMESVSKPKVVERVRLIPPDEFKGDNRLEGESFEDYKKRRKLEKMALKHYLRGEVVPPGGKTMRMARMEIKHRAEADSEDNGQEGEILP